MDAQLLNRIGIIFNFIAAFLIAPELIGLKRIEKLEKTLEKVLIFIKRNFDFYISDLKKDIKQTNLKATPVNYSYYYGYTPSNKAMITIIVIGTATSLAYFIVYLIYYHSWAVLWPSMLGLATAFSWVLNTWVLVIDRFISKTKLSSGSMVDFIGIIFIIPLFQFFFPFLVVSALFMIPLLSFGLSLFLVLYGAINLSLRKLRGSDRLRSLLVVAGIVLMIFGSVLQLMSTF
jgi:hypothetical protein